MDKPVRKIIRLDNYDYSKNGLYFITICTVQKNELLWATDVGDGAPDVPLCCAHAVGKVYLSSFGKIIRDNIGAGVSGTSRAPSPTNEIVPQYVSMLKRFINKDIGFNIFQRSYYDHIIRNQKEYIAISKYIHNNPIKWDVDEYNPRNENNKAEVLGLE